MAATYGHGFNPRFFASGTSHAKPNPHAITRSVKSWTAHPRGVSSRNASGPSTTRTPTLYPVNARKSRTAKTSRMTTSRPQHLPAA